MTKKSRRPLPTLFAALCLLASPGFTLAQEQPPQPQQPAPATTTTYPLRQILIESSVEASEKLSFLPKAGFLVIPSHLSFLSATELQPLLSSAENRSIDDRLLTAIVQVIQNYLRRKDFPIATAVIPPQRIADGALRVVVLLGKFREIKIQGNRWFSDTLIKEKLRVTSGEIVKFSELDRAVAWTNNSPYRRIRAHVDPIPNTDEANLIIGVEERMPLRAFASVDNSGNAIIGERRFIAGASYGNVWGRDHELTYQLVTTDLPRVFQAHGFNYRVPLARRHSVQLSGFYSHAQPEFYGGLFIQDGESISSDLRYTLTLREGQNPIEAFASMGFKESNNNLEFGGTQVDNSKTDTFHATFGITAIRRDSRGAWLVGASVTASPGNLNSRNTDDAFQPARFGAKARYMHASLTLQRGLALPQGWELTARANLQVASTNLLTSEQLSIGGANSVRGFTDNTFVGDQGFVAGAELATPTLRMPLVPKKLTGQPIDGRLIAFCETANVDLKHRFPMDRQFEQLTGAGIGARVNWAGRLSFIFDHGRQLSRLPFPIDRRYRTHVKLSFSY